MIALLWQKFLFPLWQKMLPKLWLYGAIIVAIVIANWIGKGQGASAERERLLSIPPKVVIKTEWKHDTLRPPPIIKWIPGEPVKDTTGLAAMADSIAKLDRKELEKRAMPFAVTKDVTVTDDKNKVGVSFTMDFNAIPFRRGISNLGFRNIVSTYPYTTRDSTIYVPLPQHTIDISFMAGFAQYLNQPPLVGSGALGVGIKLNFGQWHTDIHGGGAFVEKKSGGAIFVRQEWVPTAAGY